MQPQEWSCCLNLSCFYHCRTKPKYAHHIVAYLLWCKRSPVCISCFIHASRQKRWALSVFWDVDVTCRHHIRSFNESAEWDADIHACHHHCNWLKERLFEFEVIYTICRVRDVKPYSSVSVWDTLCWYRLRGMLGFTATRYRSATFHISITASRRDLYGLAIAAICWLDLLRIGLLLVQCIDNITLNWSTL